MTTRAFELQQWLRAHGPATTAQIAAAGFVNFSGLTRQRMLDYGAIVQKKEFNPDVQKKHARIITTMFNATDLDYLPARGAKKGATFTRGAATVIARAITTLERRGYKVIKPGEQQ